MSKVYKGYELLKAITDGEITSEDKIYLVAPANRIELYWKYEYLYKKAEDINSEKDRKIDMFDIMNYEFELIEEDTIDIDSIEELVTGYSESGADTDIINYINDKIVPCIKQLNKEIKSIKEK